MNELMDPIAGKPLTPVNDVLYPSEGESDPWLPTNEERTPLENEPELMSRLLPEILIAWNAGKRFEENVSADATPLIEITAPSMRNIPINLLTFMG